MSNRSVTETSMLRATAGRVLDDFAVAVTDSLMEWACETNFVDEDGS